jgi:hypothetical protein
VQVSFSLPLFFSLLQSLQSGPLHLESKIFLRFVFPKLSLFLVSFEYKGIGK